MKISCIIPTYNRKEFLVEAVNSVLSQTRKPDEIIIVNNGDERVFLSDKLSKHVKVYDIVRNAGASQTRNFGAGVATGDYLAFLDDDDLWGSDYLKNVTGVIRGKSNLVVSRLDCVVADGVINPFKNPSKTVTIDNILTKINYFNSYN